MAVQTRIDSRRGGAVDGIPARGSQDGVLAGDRLAVAWRRVSLADGAASASTPTAIYRRLAGGEAPSFLLESAGEAREPGRYSIAAAGCAEEYVCDAGTRERPFSAIEERLSRLRLAVPPEMPPCVGGLIGYIAYDAVRTLERLPIAPPDDLGLPSVHLVLPSRLAVIDHHQRVAWLIGVGLGRGAQAEAQVQRARAQEALESRVDGRETVEFREAAGAVPQGYPEALGCHSTFLRPAFEAAVERVKVYIAAGDAYQVVLSQRLSRPFAGDPFAVYRHLRDLNPSPYLFYLDFGGHQLAGSSPETLVSVRDGLVRTRPIAGTRPRTGDPARDAELARELAHDPKELAEHRMLVDLGRNDVGRVSTFGTVHVEPFEQVERYARVMHLVSEVSGKLLPGRSAVEALAACFPAGTLSGAPKIRAMEIIDELEPVARGPYGGAIGYFGLDGSADLAITIRTALFAGGQVHVQAGAGIVADSTPVREYEETLFKASAVLSAVAAAERPVAPPRASHLPDTHGTPRADLGGGEHP